MESAAHSLMGILQHVTTHLKESLVDPARVDVVPLPLEVVYHIRLAANALDRMESLELLGRWEEAGSAFEAFLSAFTAGICLLDVLVGDQQALPSGSVGVVG